MTRRTRQNPTVTVKDIIPTLGASAEAARAAIGAAGLDGSGKLLTAQMPDLSIVDYLGTVANQTAMLALTGQKGDWCIRSDTGAGWIITGANPALLGSWTQMPYPASTTVGEVAAQIVDPVTTIGAAAAAAFLTRSVSVDALLDRFDNDGVAMIIPHRGAGAQMAPQNTLAAFKIGASYGLGLCDGGDWRTTTDGALACFHDATTDAVADRNRTVSDMSGAEASLMNIDCSSWFGGGFPDTKVMIADELFGTLGGTVVMTPEPKDLAAGQHLAGIIERMGIQPSVLPNAFDPTFLAPFHDVGCPHLLLNITSMPSAPTRAGYLAAGINWLGVPWNGSITPANVTTLHGEGFRILLGTVYRKYHMTGVNDWASVQSKIACYASDDPLYFSHALDAANVSRYRRTTDPFATKAYYHGHLAQVAADVGPVYRGQFYGQKRWGFNVNETRWVLAGWGCPLATPTSYTLDYYVTFDNMGSDDTRWLGVTVGMASDRGYADSASNNWETGYQCYYRRSGQLVVLPKNAGVAGTASTQTSQGARAALVTTSALTAGAAITSIPVTSLPAAISAGTEFRLPNDQIATVATGGASSGATAVPVNSITPTDTVPSGSSLPQTIPLRIVVSPTQIVFSRQDAIGGTVTVTDNTVRGPYFYLGQNASAAGFSGTFSEMTIT